MKKSRSIGKTFRAMVVSAKNALSRKKEETNNMNVFPVPDGDTGINMSLTMSGASDVGENDNLTLGEAAEQAASSMLRSARGNSGAILSLFFRGVSKTFHGLKTAGTRTWVEAFENGAKEAYRAVMSPSEGTILTVMRVAAEDARAAYEANRRMDVEELFDVVVASAERTLAQTPEMLPVLKEAGVVDAGGYGFVCVLQGMKAVLDGTPITALDDDGEETAEADFSEFHSDEITYGYCTECIVDKNEESVGEGKAADFAEFLTSIGDSVVFVDDESIIKLHVHTNDPGAVLSRAITYGSLASVKIENMRKQHTALADGAKKKAGVGASADPSKTITPVRAEKDFGFVSVCMGEGIQALFADLGADAIVSGGQTMNPSTQDLINAIYKTPARTVFVLPNNKNIAMVARAAAELTTERDVVVLDTVSVPQGIAAMIAYNPDASKEENLSAMDGAIRRVTTMSVTYAVRDTKVGRFRIAKGQFLGLVENTIACVTDSEKACMEQLMRGMTDAAFVTLLYGENVTAEEAEAVGEQIRSKTEGRCEVTVICGGQPIYDYIVSVEQ